jgi:hypothetical protein
MQGLGLQMIARLTSAEPALDGDHPGLTVGRDQSRAQPWTELPESARMLIRRERAE